MSTLDKLRALHREVCRAWRRQTEPAISEGEAEILNLGFRFMEQLVIGDSGKVVDPVDWRDKRNNILHEYLQRVHSQFDSDADIKITEVPHNE